MFQLTESGWSPHAQDAQRLTSDISAPAPLLHSEQTFERSVARRQPSLQGVPSP